MGYDRRIILNGQDDVARRKMAKSQLSARVEAASVDEFGLLKSVTKGVGGLLVKGAKALIPGGDDKGGGGTPFDEKKHPRGPDGKFTEAPASGPGSSEELEKSSEKLSEEIKERSRALYKQKLAKWETDKAKHEADEIVKANKKIKSINDGELKKANNELKKARDYLKRTDLTDDQIEAGTKKFQSANKKVKGIKTKISKIKPEPFEAKKPKEGEDDEE